MKKKSPMILMLILLVMAGCGWYRAIEWNSRYGPPQAVDRQINAPEQGAVSFHDQVQPVLEKRCDVCHSCYDAPCQLKLTSFEGIDRGGSKTLVYDAARIESIAPTRLSVDADSAEKWREMGFHPVLNERAQSRSANLENSVLNLMLQLKKENPMPLSDLLPETFDLRLDHHYLCTTAEEFDDYQQKYPLWGMPYALPGLTDREMQTLVEWVAEGGKATPPPDMSDPARRIISRWEVFLNGNSMKEQLVSRYLYEHLFIGHIHFDTLPDREFYRLVRSKTPPGEPVEEINTVRPYDDPGVSRLYYRFRRIESTIVAKDHTVYYLSPSKMERFRELFLQNDYAVTRLPSYTYPDTANPFITFAEIPAKSRYEFMLDDACYFVMGFIKGPVCRGQIALNVINDHFFVAFADPDKDPISRDTEFLHQMSGFLRLPSEKRSNIRIIEVWQEYRELQKKYLEGREAYLEKTDPENTGKQMDGIWNGDGKNKNALLTIFRHFDSASVVKGFVGKPPKTGWVVDYPLFERIHYLLVAGFNVFGNLGHQAETRIFMDYLRMEGESNFLTFLPASSRKAIWDDWYIDPRKDALHFLEDQFHGLKRETRIDFHTKDPKNEFFEKLMQHAGPEIAGQDDLNRCPDRDCADDTQNPYEPEADRHMKRLSSLKGRQVQVFPDLIFVHVVTPEPEKDLVYSVIRNKELSNNSMMFREDRRRLMDNDTLTVVKGYVGSYPNAFTRIPIDEIGPTIDKYLKIKDEIGYYRFARKYSIQRNCPCFWEESDWHYAKALELQPIEGGLFDLYRFHRIGERADADILKW